MPRYEFEEGSSSKFWEISLDGGSFTTRYGKIGTDGQETTKSFASAAQARKEYDKIIASKVKKGYQLVESDGDDGSDDDDGDGHFEAVSNPALEAAIYEDPDNVAAYQVYGDWLESKGDPRGQLIAVQHALLSAKPGEQATLKKSEAALLAAHRDELLGEELAEHDGAVSLTWHLGFMRSARFALDYDSAQEGISIPDLTRALVTHPSGRFVQELVFGMIDFEGENQYQEVIDVLAELRPRALRSLFLGDFEYPDDTEMSWSHVGDTSALYPALPGLQKLVTQGCSPTLGKIELPALRDFEVRTGGLSRAALESIAAARWPKLERLVIWFGSNAYGAEGGLEEIRPILEGKGLPNLRHLGLVNGEFADDLCRVLPRSKVVAQLQTLDLSMGTMSDEGAQALADGKSALSHLERLVVRDNTLTPAAERVLRGVAKQIDFGSQRDFDPEYRYASVGE